MQTLLANWFTKKHNETEQVAQQFHLLCTLHFSKSIPRTKFNLPSSIREMAKGKICCLVLSYFLLVKNQLIKSIILIFLVYRIKTLRNHSGSQTWHLMVCRLLYICNWRGDTVGLNVYSSFSSIFIRWKLISLQVY